MQVPILQINKNNNTEVLTFKATILYIIETCEHLKIKNNTLKMHAIKKKKKNGVSLCNSYSTRASALVDL